MADRSADVIVIGGGVAGLAAAGELARRNLRVVVIEARDRLGGRVLSVRKRGWAHPIELGAQFVHGGNEALWKLLKKHRIATTQVVDDHWHGETGTWTRIDAAARIAAVTKRIDSRRMRGWSFADFLAEQGAALPEVDRKLALGFAEGFEAAPVDEMSAVALAGETFEDGEQYMIPDGYDQVVNALVTDLTAGAAEVVTNAACTSVVWSRRQVEVRAAGTTWRARSAILTVPLAVLQASPSQRGGIAFSPRLPRRSVISAMRMGQVIRMNFRFDRRRWRGLLPAALQRKQDAPFGFVHTDERALPVWWSLTDDATLTAWAGGPRASALASRPEAEIRRTAVAVLSRVLDVPASVIDAAALDSAMHNWSRDPFSRGAYTFIRAGHDDASSRLREPLRDTLFFAGEATADGEETGTVHGALASGIRAAKEIVRALN
ncbi:MAG TPA: NAD(P)/FAD-dependent oxidoreductase [Opitutaceae bacterium]|nr:NAD(P)/FAD-dependent oxidoreductase [Opitutaceae bacterium]